MGTSVEHPHGHEAHDHAHDDHAHHEHDHGHGRGLLGRVRELLAPHSHDAADSVDHELESSERGMERPAIVGNRAVLAGAVLYLLEWVAIIPAGDSGPADAGTSRADVLKLYQDHPKAVLLITTWCAAVLLGRVLIVTGLRTALRSVGAATPLTDLAVAAMTLSVALELLSLVAVGTAQVLAVRGGQDDLVVALDTAAGLAFLAILPPLGTAVGLSAWSMLRSRAFATWIPAVGLVSGALLVLGGVLGGPGYLESGTLRDLGGVGMIGIPLFWVWMLATGVFLWRRTPGQVEG